MISFESKAKNTSNITECNETGRTGRGGDTFPDLDGPGLPVRSQKLSCIGHGWCLDGRPPGSQGLVCRDRQCSSLVLKIL